MGQVALDTKYGVQASSLTLALAEWLAALGKDCVKTDASTLDRYSRSCGAKDTQPLAVLYPSSVEKLKEIVAISNARQIPIYPISRGKNWGYGSASPASEGNVIVDLSQMNAIAEVNEELAYAVVEPGVTQQQLFEYLEEYAPSLFMDVTGSTPEASVLGNLVERGFGQTPYSDHFLHSAGMEVLLADGTLLHTGFGHFPNAQTAHLFKWGVGPFLDGIFTQSNFGIVTKVGIWLMPKPEHQGVFLVRFKDDAHFVENIDALRMLKLKGVLPSAVHVVNDLRVIATLQTYPFESTKGETPLPEPVLEKLRRKWDVPPWTCVGGLYGSRGQIRAALAELRRALGRHAHIEFISARRMDFLARHQWLHPFVGFAKLKPRIGLLNLVKGIPTTRALRGMYWRKTSLPAGDDYNPERDRCGILWCSPIIPMRRSDLESFLTISRKLFSTHGFETNIAVSLVAERAVCCTVGVVFDESLPDETVKARRCHYELLQAYATAGYIPYRFGSDLNAYQSLLGNKIDPFFKICSLIKEALDPRCILAPGRYNLTSH